MPGDYICYWMRSRTFSYLLLCASLALQRGNLLLLNFLHVTPDVPCASIIILLHLIVMFLKLM